MPIVEKINIHSAVSKQNIKDVLSYAVKNRKGYYKQLLNADEKKGETIDMFISARLIKTGHTLKNETYKITDLGDQYYMELFGEYEYYKKRLSGMLKRTMKNFIDRFLE